jgi:hypothetical protein
MARAGTTSPELDTFRHWAQSQFVSFRAAVAYLVTTAGDEESVGTAFHVGDGVLVTARHVVEGRSIKEIGFGDDSAVSQQILRTGRFKTQTHGAVSVLAGPCFHSNPLVDVACLKVNPVPRCAIPLGGHLDDWLGQYDLVLHRTLLLGYPPIPLTTSPTLVASVGEVNALVDLYVGCKHPHFIISTMARGGTSGAPALVAYNELNVGDGTAVLGIVTQSLTRDDHQPEIGYLAVLSVEPIYDCLEQHGMLPPAQKAWLDIE